MAIFFKKMEKKESAIFCQKMIESGDLLDLSAISGIKVDKHSTGGVGDKTTLVLTPLVAATGVPVAKLSGRGLGHTGGTIDKYESFSGIQMALPNERFIEIVQKIGLACIGSTANLAPADKFLYGLRDSTSTVENVSLIAGSIMSKKIAAGSNAILLDVKVGCGAFMKTLEDARVLAREMVDIGNNLNRKTMAVITGMDQPLGYAVGNALEVIESINTLKGKGPKDLKDLCVLLGGYMMKLGEKVSSIEEGKKRIEEKIENGEGLKKFREMIVEQGGKGEEVDDPENLLPKASIKKEIRSSKGGFVERINAEAIGIGAMKLGAGRKKKDDIIDYSAGIILRKKIGDAIEEGGVIAEIFTNKKNVVEEVEEDILKAFELSENPVKVPDLVKEIIE